MGASSDGFKDSEALLPCHKNNGVSTLGETVGGAFSTSAQECSQLFSPVHVSLWAAFSDPTPKTAVHNQGGAQGCLGSPRTHRRGGLTTPQGCLGTRLKCRRWEGVPWTPPPWKVGGGPEREKKHKSEKHSRKKSQTKVKKMSTTHSGWQGQFHNKQDTSVRCPVYAVI